MKEQQKSELEKISETFRIQNRIRNKIIFKKRNKIIFFSENDFKQKETQD